MRVQDGKQQKNQRQGILYPFCVRNAVAPVLLGRTRVRIDKEHFMLAYEDLGRVCLSSSFMSEEDKKMISSLVEMIVNIFEKYEEEAEKRG